MALLPYTVLYIHIQRMQHRRPSRSQLSVVATSTAPARRRGRLPGPRIQYSAGSFKGDGTPEHTEKILNKIFARHGALGG